MHYDSLVHFSPIRECLTPFCLEILSEPQTQLDDDGIGGGPRRPRRRPRRHFVSIPDGVFIYLLSCRIGWQSDTILAE